MNYILITLIVALLISVVLLIIAIVYLHSKLDDLRERIWYKFETCNDIQNSLRSTLLGMERRTSFYLPRIKETDCDCQKTLPTSTSCSLNLGYSFNDEYIGIEKVIYMIFQHFGMELKRMPENIYLGSSGVIQNEKSDKEKT